MLVYGRNVAKEILSGNKKINKITIIEDFSDKDILSLIEKRNIKPICLKKNEFSRFDKFSHQGIILDIEDFCYSDYTEFLNVENAKVVVLDHLEDPHNLGAIIRTCEAAGITGIIIPKDVCHILSALKSQQLLFTGGFMYSQFLQVLTSL